MKIDRPSIVHDRQKTSKSDSRGGVPLKFSSRREVVKVMSCDFDLCRNTNIFSNTKTGRVVLKLDINLN